MLKRRLKFFALLGVLGGLGLTACGEKKEETAPPAEKQPEEASAVSTPQEAPPAAPDASGLEAMAKAMGFAKYLPKSTHMYAGVFDGRGFVDSLRESKLAKFLEEQAKEEAGLDLDQLEEDPQAAMILSLFSEEMFVAVGQGVPEQTGNLLALNESSTRHWIKFMVKMGEAQVTGEELGGPGFGGPDMMMPFVGGFLGDPAGGLAILEKSQMPPLTIGFKVSDDEVRGQLAGMAAGGLEQMLMGLGPDGEDIAEAVNVTRGDSQFTGVKIVGEKVAAKIDGEAKEQMSQMMDAASIEKLIKTIESKNMVIAVGTHEDYVIGFTGTDADELQMAATPGDSVLSRPEMNFMNSYADKKLLGVMSVSEELQKSLAKHSTLLGSLVLGLKEGLSETEGFGDTRDLEVLLELIARQEKEIFGMYSYSPAGVVAYREEGLKVEAYGGSNMADLDLDKPRQYASLGAADDVFLFANWVENPVYTEKALEYLDSIGETVYLGAKHVTKLEIDDPDIRQFVEGFGMFDEKIRPHLKELWTGLRSDLVTGLGSEGALIVDLQGDLPTVPGLPQVVVDEGKAPRLGMLAPAEDKDQLEAAWKRIDAAAQGLLKVASEMTGENIPMQRPMSSEKNDLKTWFFPFPFQTDDFVISVSVDQENFYASTSKSFVQALSAKLEEAETDESQKGAYFHANFTLLNSYLNEWLALVEANSGKIFGEGSPAAEDFQENLPMVKEVVAATSELKSVTAHVRNAGGTIRSSLHIKTGE